MSMATLPRYKLVEMLSNLFENSIKLLLRISFQGCQTKNECFVNF
jgi:hypothetical protein